MNSDYSNLVDKVLGLANKTENPELFKKKYVLLNKFLKILIDCKNDARKFNDIEQLILLLLKTYKKDYAVDELSHDHDKIEANQRKLFKLILKKELLINNK